MRPLNKKYFDAVAVDTNGEKIFASSIIQVSLTGKGVADLAGTVKLQASNDFDNSADLDSFVPTNWVDVEDATASLASGGAIIIPKTDICYQWIRFVFTKSGGTTGSFTAYIKTNAI